MAISPALSKARFSVRLRTPWTLSPWILLRGPSTMTQTRTTERPGDDDRAVVDCRPPTALWISALAARKGTSESVKLINLSPSSIPSWVLEEIQVLWTPGPMVVQMAEWRMESWHLRFWSQQSRRCLRWWESSSCYPMPWESWNCQRLESMVKDWIISPGVKGYIWMVEVFGKLWNLNRLVELIKDR